MMNRKIKNYALFVYIACLCVSCKQSYIKDAERISLQPVSITEDLETTMPGGFCVTDNYILWSDPFSKDHFIHVLNKEGEELLQMVKIGQGPEEFITPGWAVLPADQLLVYDLNQNRQFIYSIDRMCQGADPILSKSRDSITATTIIALENGQRISLDPDAGQPFSITRAQQTYLFGKYPFEAKVENAYAAYQGRIAYSPEKKLFVYAVSSFPYFALYTYENGTMNLAKEKFFTEDAKVEKNKVIYDRSRKGVSELVLTKDYIVALQRDYTVDDTDEQTVGRNFSKAPQTLFLYNYDLELVKIVNLPVPAFRLASEPDSNTIYAIVVNPDFSIVKVEL